MVWPCSKLETIEKAQEKNCNVYVVNAKSCLSRAEISACRELYLAGEAAYSNLTEPGFVVGPYLKTVEM